MKLLFSIILTLIFVNCNFAQIAGNSLRLKADTNYVSINDASSQSLNNTMTWEFWIYNRCLSDVFVSPITKGYCQATWSYYFGIDTTNGTQMVFYKFKPSGTQSCSTDQGLTPTVEYRTPIGSVPHNTWIHVACVMNGTTVQFYLNGQQVTTTLTFGNPFVGIKSSTQPLLIGAYHFASSTRYGTVPKANIDEVRIWHIARTASEILNHYQSTLVGNEAGLIAYYKFEETGNGGGITVTNSAVGSTIANGITVGSAANLFFENNSAVVNISQICQALPLQLLSFTAKREGKNSILTWTTAREINVDRFEIEQSLNGKEFDKIGQVKAGLTTYVFNDNNAKNAMIYYRLKMVDKDGKFTYSKIVSVNISNTTKAEIFPNPVKSTANIQLQLQHAESITLKIVSSDGKVLSTKKYSLTVGNNLLTLNTEHFSTGVYAVVIARQNTNEHLTFSKQ